MSARMLSTVVGLMLVASAAFAQTANDDLLTLDVIRSINTYTRFTIFDDINVKVDNGTVTLLGKVTMPFKKDDLGERVARVRGVKTLNNQLEVLPASKSDDELRVGIANAIYSHPSFDRFTGPDRPIHVIVERGRVTLEGFVNTEADRLAALSIARSFGSFAVTDELKTQAQVRAEQQKKQ